MAAAAAHPAGKSGRTETKIKQLTLSAVRYAGRQQEKK